MPPKAPAVWTCSCCPPSKTHSGKARSLTDQAGCNIAYRLLDPNDELESWKICNACYALPTNNQRAGRADLLENPRLGACPVCHKNQETLWRPITAAVVAYARSDAVSGKDTAAKDHKYVNPSCCLTCYQVAHARLPVPSSETGKP